MRGWRCLDTASPPRATALEALHPCPHHGPCTAGYSRIHCDGRRRHVDRTVIFKVRVKPYIRYSNFAGTGYCL